MGCCQRRNPYIVQFGAYFSNLGSYSTNLQNAAVLPNLTLLGGTTWAPSTLTPADYWVSFVSNQSLGGNQAVYYNPVVQACVNAFTNSTNVAQIVPLCTQAQAQIYNDAPYTWLGVMKLWYAGGSLVWEKSIIRSFYVEQLMAGGDTAPLFNTVTFQG